MNFFRSNLEKDFEFFVRNLPQLQPIEFFGLAKILSVPMVRLEELKNLNKEDLEKMKLEDLKENENYIAEILRPMDEILEQMMDRFLELPRRRRKEINQILKDAKRGR